MYRHILAFLLLASVAAHGAMSGANQTRLRQLLRMPSLDSGSGGLDFSFKDGVIIHGWREDRSTEITRLHVAMKGNAADADRYSVLGLLQSQGMDTNAAASFRKAVELYRQQGASTNTNAAVVVNFARALLRAGESGEALALLRQATDGNPKDAPAWSALAVVLGDRALTNVLGPAVSQVTSVYAVLYDAMSKPFPAAALIAAQRDMAKAVAASDRALALAPRDPEVHADRVVINSIQGFLRGMLALKPGKAGDTDQALAEMFSADTLASLWRYADLMPGDPKALLTVALFQASYGGFHGSRAPVSDRERDNTAWALFSEETRRMISLAAGRLGELEKGTNKVVALTAMEAHGLLLYAIMDEQAPGEVLLKRVFQRDPARDFAWKVLVSSTAGQGNFAAAMLYCEDHLKVRDDALTRIALAKLCVRANRFEDAQAHVDAALKFDPTGFESNLAAAVLLLKRNATPESIQKAEKYVATYLDSPWFPQVADQEDEHAYAIAIINALAGRIAEGRAIIGDYLGGYPDDEEAKEVQTILKRK